MSKAMLELYTYQELCDMVVTQQTELENMQNRILAIAAIMVVSLLINACLLGVIWMMMFW